MNSFISGRINSGVNTQAFSLKRTRSFEGRKFDASSAPALPQLNADLILQVYTHKSLRRPGVTPGESGDNERLADLGKAVFNAALTRFLYHKRPMLMAQDIEKQSRKLLSNGMIEDWVTHYRLMRRLVFHPSVSKTNQDSTEEIHSLFYAYVGGLFLTSGPEAVNYWIDRLLSQENVEPESTMKADPYAAVMIPPQKRAKSETMSPPPPIFFASQPPPLPTARPMLPNFSTPIPPNPLSPAQPQAAFLPLFNEAAMRRRVTVEYLAEFSGPSHAGRWTVKCIVNGICKGEGSSSHKQTAKEEAARKAYYSMGWQ